MITKTTCPICEIGVLTELDYVCPPELEDYKQKMAEIARISQELGLMGDYGYE